MSMLLLIRSADDVRSAVEAASEFLVYRRRHFAEPREVDEVLGMWRRRELEANLPAWLWFDRELGAGIRMGSHTGEGASAQGPTEAAVGIRESFSLSGLWTFCWIDGTFLRGAKSPNERRRRIPRPGPAGCAESSLNPRRPSPSTTLRTTPPRPAPGPA